ncbi:MAG TPA: acyl-CoA thioesterase [Lachnospiraceae bacterium]|nr:thioesterase family protein [uncultured Lachnoclostridium sp.]HAU86658.1 acyl-CoA thioesterase [Lachnospiraceae bacterium]
MDWITYTYEFQVRFRDTDAYGIVHHSNYFCFFEEARYEFSKVMLGMYDGNEDMEELKFPVLKAECEYRHALEYDMKDYIINLKFRIEGESKIEFRYELCRKDEKKVYARGKTVHGILDKNDKLCLVIPQWLRNQIEGKVNDEG